MSKISIYEVVPVPKLADKLVGTSVGGDPEDITYNFTLSELLNLFIPNIPGNTLQGVLDFGNTATQNINLTGIITTTTLNVGSTANILNSNLTGQTHITGGLYDRLNSIGTAGQVLTSTGTQVQWYTIPTVIPDLQQVLASGNTAVNNIILTGNLSANNAALLTSTISTSLTVLGTLKDGLSSVGTNNQVLSSNVTGVRWVNLPVYSATSPLLYNSGTGVFSIQQANASQNGYLSSADWITFDGKQTAISLTTTGNSGASTLVGATINVPNYTLSGLGGVPQIRTLTINGVTYNLSADRSWTLATGVSSVTATTPLSSTGGVNPDISIQQSSSSLDGYLSSTDWLMFNNKQPAGNYITSLTGEATAAGPGAASVTLSNAAVIGKLLTGLNITGSAISSSDSILTAFGKVQNQINGLIGGVQFQGVWNAATNTPALVSSVGTQGYYYIVDVAGNTNLNGITDWQVGDWAIFNGSTWNKVDNTDLVTSVNGQVGAVSLTTDNIPEGATNLYYLDSRARAALSFAAGSGAYNNTTGVITIPTDNSQILNGAGYITLVSLSATSPLSYNNLTGAFSIQVANTTQNGYLSSTDWNTFNGKQDYLNGTGLVKSVAGVISYITDNSANWNTAYNDSIVSAAVTGTATKTLTLNQQDGGTITASWSDIDTGLTSVGVSMPSAFSVANSPLTSNGTIAITGSGSTLQYIDGTGALQNFPGLTGYVPYTGATQNVDLGEFGISAGYFQADLTPTGTLQVGRMQWNATDGTMDLRLLGNNVTLQIGQENVTRVVNKSGVNLLEANYQVVRIRKVAEGGAQGQRLAVVLAQGNNENNSTEVIGLVTETINNNQEGFVTAFGEVKEINTTGSLQGETWVDGDILYLSSTVAGALTNVRPVAPNHAVIVGYVVYAHVNNGKIYMAIDTGYELGELHNVYAPTPTANQSIYWDTTNSRYQLNTIGGILGYTPANAATTISTTAPLQGGGDLSANRTFSITQSGASTNGYLSSTDWNTFNDKQPLITAGTTLQYYRGDKTFQTLNTTVVPEGTNLYYLDSRARTAISLTTTGSSGAATYNNTTGVFNIPDYGSALTGYVPTSRQLSINGTAYDLSADRSWSVGTVTAVAALTLGTTGTDLSSSVATGTTTPVITLNVPTASAANRGALSAADWSTFNTKVGGVTATSPLFSSGGSTPNLTIQQSSGSQAGYLSSTDWTTFNNKQAAGNYITSLTGEATATGPGAAAVTLDNAAVTGKILTGVNITGGTVLATDTMLTAFGKLQNQVNGLIGGSIYQGTWNAATNTPTLTSSVGTQGYYYIVSVAGTTNLDGITDWFVGDWAIFNGGVWQQVDNTDAVVSVNGQTGAVSLTTDNIPEGVTNLYYTDTRARAALSFAAGSGAYNSTTGVITIPTNTSQLTNGANFITLASLSGTAPIQYNNTTGVISITQAGTASNGYLSSTDWNTFNNKAPSVVGGYLPLSGGALTGPITSSSSAVFFMNGSFALKLDSASSTDENDLRFAKGGVDYGAIQTSGSTGNFEFYVNTDGTSGGWNQSVILKKDATRIDFLISNAINTTINSSGLSSVGGTFSSNVYVSGGVVTTTGNGVHLFYESSYAQIQLNGGTTAGSLIDFSTSGSDYKGRIIYRNSTNQFEFNTNGVGTPALTLESTGAASFSSSVTASSLIKSGGTSSQFLMADGSVNTSVLPSGAYLPLTGGTLTGDLLITKSAIPKIEINATSTSSYSYFANQENGVLKTYFVYLNSLFADVDRRENLEIRNQVGPITFWANGSKALTIANSGAATFTSSITVTNSISLSNSNVAPTGGGIYQGINLVQIVSGADGFTVNSANNLAVNFRVANTGATTISNLAGTGTRMVVADANGLLSTQAIGSGSVTGSGTANKVAKFTATGSVIGDSIITATSDAVTITSSLVGSMFTLEQATAAAYSQMRFFGDTQSAYIFKGNSAYTSYGGTNALNFYTDAGTGAGGFAFHPATITNAVFIDNAGNFGIGVGNAPTAKLDIAGGNAKLTNNVNGGAVLNTLNNSSGTSAYSGLLVGNNVTTAGGGFLMLGPNYPTTGPYTSNGAYAFGNQAGGLTIAAEVGTLKFVTGSTIKGTMLANGNLGLNETAPTNLLHLAGGSATPSLRLASVSVGYWYDIGRENLTTGDFLINGTYAGTSNGTLLRIHQTNFTVTTAGTINAKNTSTLAGLGATAVIGAGEFMSTGSVAGYFWENRSGGVTSNSNWYGWYTSAGVIRLFNGASDILQIAGSSGDTRIYGSLGIGRDPAAPLDVYKSTGGALVYMQNTNTVGYSGIDIFRQNGTHAGSVWCANDSAGATNNRNALTIAARTANEKVIIVGGGYDPTVTGGLTVAGSQAKLEGTNPYHLIQAALGDYCYVHLQNNSGGTARNAYFIQNRSAATANGVAAGAAYLYFGETQNMEFVWAGTSRVQITSSGNVTAAAFFESSDSRLKTIIKDDYKALGVESVKARLYLKDGKEEIGYYAQDFESILPSAVSKNDVGFLSLSYTQVHTAKIAIIEDEVTVLKRRVAELEAKLN